MNKTLLITLIVLFSAALASAVNIAPGGTVSESFSIGTSATATLPTDWKADKNATARLVGTYSAAVTATEQRAGDNMSSSAANGIYNYGAGPADTATDRAVGGISSSSSSKSVNVYVKLTNNGAGTISSFTISYAVEKYRKGSNAAGFAVQMYYSTDGSTWTSAGSNFLTEWAAADADNSGYASAPGDTKSVSSKTLSVSLAAGNTLYLAWNYSVRTGTTTSNAQGLGLDDVSITAASGGAPGSAIVITNGGATVTVNSYELKGTNDNVVGTMIFSNTTTGVQYTQTAPGSPFGWSQTFSSLASGANSIVVTGTNTANTRATATTTITYNPPAPATASNLVAVTALSSAQETVVGMPVSIVTGSWSNHLAQIGYGPTSNGSGWLWFTVSASAGGLGYSASASVTLPIGTNYIGARWINGGITNYGWSSAGQINVTALATPLYIVVTNTPSMILTTPWNFSNGNLNGVTCGAGMSTNLPTTPNEPYQTGFEDATKAAYAPGDVVLSNITWNMDNAVIGNLANDKKIDAQSSRNRAPFTNTMVDAKAGGAGTVSLKYARYGTDAGVVAQVEYSVGGGEWTPAGASFDSTSVDTLTDWSATLNVSGSVRLRILSMSGTAGLRMNIDNITVTSYGGGGGYSGVLAVDGFSHSATADTYSNVTFAISTAGYDTPGFYCTVQRDSTGPRKLDLDFYSGSGWDYATATYELPAAGTWYTIGRSFAVGGTAGTRFRLVGYGATGSELQIKDVTVTAPVPEPALLAIAGLVALAFLRRR